MIKNFHQVDRHLYRGAAPAHQDIVDLSNKLGINKIISLDANSGKHISPVCNLLGINHNIINIEPNNINSLKHLLSQDISSLLNKNDNIFVHCKRGKDRTGLLIALYRCLFDNWDCRKALKEAKQLGFGTGIELPIEKFYTKLIAKACGKNHTDTNDAYDIISNVQDFDSMYRDEEFDPYNPSWYPHADAAVRKYPEAFVNLDSDIEQYPTRENYDLKGINTEKPMLEHIPMVGIYDQNTQITNLVGPSMVGGGFV